MPPVHSAGFSTSCQQEIEDTMKNRSEFEKLVSASGAAIIALVPLILSVSGPPTADLSELFLAGEGLVFYMSAALTFGLPTVQLRSRFPEEAKQVKNDNDLQSPDVHANKLWSHRWIHCTFFVIVQILLLFAILFLNSFPIFGNIHPIWICDGALQLALHITLGFFALAVGLVWFLGLHSTYSKLKHTKKALVLYPSDKFLERSRGFIARLLARFAQVITVIALTSIFWSVYGASIATALMRVATVVVYVFFSRTLSIWFSRCICAEKIFVTYDTVDERECIVGRYNRMYPDLPTQSRDLGSQQQAIPLIPRIPSLILDGISMPTEE